MENLEEVVRWQHAMIRSMSRSLIDLYKLLLHTGVISEAGIVNIIDDVAADDRWSLFKAQMEAVMDGQLDPTELFGNVVPVDPAFDHGSLWPNIDGPHVPLEGPTGPAESAS